MTEATDETFDQLVSQPGHVFVVFYTLYMPHYEQVGWAAQAASARELPFVMVNIDRCPAIQQREQVIGIPHFRLYRDGAIEAVSLGTFSQRTYGDSSEYTRGKIEDWLTKHLE